MHSDQRLLLVIFLILIALITMPLMIHHIKNSRRPVPVELRIVTATDSDPVYRDGRRRVKAGDPVSAALAVRVTQIGRDDRWLAPVEQLVIGSETVDHQRSSTWMDDDHRLRVFWFTIESATLGGRLTPDAAAERLRYRTFLAPEMGDGLRAARLPEPHNDDFMGRDGLITPGDVGTIRLYARLELVESADDLRPVHSVASPGVDALGTPELTSVWRSGSFGAGIRDEVGELFLLPGFEPTDESPGAWENVTMEAFGRSFTDLVDERLVVSSWTFAAVAVSGSTELRPIDLDPLGKRADIRSTSTGEELRWGKDVRPGDLAASGQRWLVLLADEGNGVLDPADAVLHCWGQPPQRTTLLTALDPRVDDIELFRHAE
jgi:hypothetical protein